MPLIKNLREQKKEFLEALDLRFTSPEKFREGLKVYEQFRSLKKEVDDLRAERNKKTVEFSKTKNKKIIEEVRKIKKQISDKESRLNETEAALRSIELTLPNWVHKETPIGRDDAKNVAVKYWGVPLVKKEFEEQFKQKFPGAKFTASGKKQLHHADIVELFDLADTETASKISGSRFYIEKNELAVLDLALSLHTMREFIKLGFTPVVPPYMIKREVEEKITYFTSFEDAIYSLAQDDLILITTAEHPLAAMYRDTMFNKKDLPIRMVAFSPAFRREAGSHGKDTKGIFRTHQFNKVELHSIVEPGRDMEELEFLIDCVEKVMRPLKFPYRIVKNSSGDMDNRALIQYDLEAWFPAQNEFRELHSLATVGSWISEKLNTKVIINNEKFPVANLYATGAAVQRTLLAIFVNNYDADRNVIKIPKVLQEVSGIKAIRVKSKK